MTVKELKEKLEKFDDHLIVMIPNEKNFVGYVVAHNVSQGVNEFDGAVFIDDYVEDDDD